MSFTDNYLALFEEEKKKKKKKTTAEKTSSAKTGHSFTDNYLALTEQEEQDSIAPLYVNKTAALYQADDIAPVVTEKEDEEKRTWFTSGAFEDGYQIGDISKTILGTTKDLRENLYAGAVGIAEKTIDAGAYIVGGIGGLLGADDFRDRTADFIKRDLIDEEKVAVTMDILNGGWGVQKQLGDQSVDDVSLLGERSDALVQSAGQLAGTLGLQMVGVPWFVTSGVTGFGGEAENALNQGATYGRAGLSAAISAGAEVLTEKLFGGSGLGEKGLIAVDSLTKGISNKIVKALADYGVDVLAEGSEEVISQFASNLGSSLYREEKLGDILFSEEAIDGYIESAIGGGVLGGVMNVGNVANSIRSGRDYRTGLSENEQKVVDKEYENRLAEEAKDRELSKKDKEKIYNEVLNDLDEGGISIDTIEEVLGGEAYKNYQNTVKNEDSLRETFNQLNQMKQGEMTGEQIDLRNELKEKLKEMETSGERNALKTRLSESVFGMVQNDRLIESYNERSRRGQAFEADVTKYDAKQQQTIQKAIDSGILNNTRRTHKFVEMIAKITADKGVPFDFANNQKLKDSGFAMDGKTVNGFVTKDGITLNIDSDKAMNSVVGHEITHVLEGTELYTELQSVLTEYAKSKGEYDSRLSSLTKLYEGVKDADVNAELTADLVGDYLFTDPDFINHLSTNNRNVFQKIYDEIKYLCKVATAGSKEARELEKVKRAFEKAYKEGGKAQTETKYSVSETTDGRFAAVVDSDILANINTGTWDKATKDAAKTAASNALKQFSEGIVVDGITRKVNRTSRREYTRSNDTEKLYNKSPDVFADKMRAAEVADDIVVAATNWNRDGGLKHPRTDNFVDFDHGHTLIVSGDAKYSAEVVVGITKDGEAVFYDVVDMTPTTFDIKKEESPTTATTQNAIGDIQGDSFDTKVAQEKPVVKMSISDSDGKQLTKEQQEYFKDSKVRDENGNLQKVYHGTRKDAFTVFKSNQFKNVDNLNPTSDPDIRFSLSKPVEETKDLMALHNLQSSELMKTLDLGGLPMPSIAVIKAEAGHDQYGDVSLILPKETIDPQANKDNKVYGGDAWTPVYPKIEYKPNEKVAKKIRDKYYGLAKDIGYDEVRPMYSYVNELEDALNRAGGEAAMLEKLYEDTDMMNVYLQDSGKDKVDPIIKETVTEISEVEAEMNQFLIDAIGEDLVAALKAPDGENPMKYRAAFMEQHESEIRDAYKRYFMEVHNFTEEEANNALDNTTKRDLMKIMREAYVYTKNKGVTVRTETDLAATKEAIRKAASDGYKEWVDRLFVGVEDKSGIRNNQEYYTRSGNPRSWDALHWENTLENVVKVMKGQEDTGVGSFSPFNGLFSKAHKQYGSIAEIKADSNRLSKIPEEEYEALKDSFSNRFAEIANSIKDQAERNPFIATDIAAEQIVDAVRTQKTKDGMLNYLRKLNGRVTEQTVDDVISLVSDIANMPTGYFEAKPKRAVGFDEVGVFVIPNNIDAKVKQELLNRGYSIAEYDPNVEGDRTKVLNQFEEYKFSLSAEGEPVSSRYGAPLRDLRLETAPVQETAPVVSAESTEAMFPDDLAPVTDEGGRLESLTDADAPPEVEAPYTETDEVTVDDPFEDRDWYEVGNRKVNAYMYENPEVKPFFQAEAKVMLGELADTTKGERWYNDKLYYESGGEEGWGGTKRHTSDSIAEMLDTWKMSYADIEKGLKAIIEDNGAENIAAAKRIEFMLNDRLMNGYQDFVFGNEVPPDQDYLNLLNEKQITEYSKESFDAFMAQADQYAPPISEEMDIAPVAKTDGVAPTFDARPRKGVAEGQQTMFEEPEVTEKITRSGLHQNIVEDIKARFKEKGFDFDKVLKNAKNLSTFSTVDNTPQRVMEKALGYKEGQILGDITVNKVAQNETEGIVWLNEQIAKIKAFSKQYHIKPGSKESAAAQMYAEGFYVDENNDIIQYGDAELAADFPDAQVQANIKGLAKDARIRQLYDETLAAINESRTRNAYPAIPRLDNYFLHFRAMEDTFYRLGLPFNPNDIRAKDLPTDLNGVTADLKPGQPYFASAMHRTGKRTSFDLLGGLERYMSSAKNQIYHIDDIQTLRALRNYIADTYGQANGLENLDSLSEEEAQERIKEVYGAHLSTFAKFLNEEANVLAGKTALIDRGLEGVIGRRGMTFLDTLNKQVGSNMVGFNVSSSLTNFLPVVQTFAKGNKAAFVKAFAQTVAHKISGRSDGFTENSPVMIRRQGADRFYRNWWQKMADPGYALMGAVDNISTELIARTKYNELVGNGMDSQKAHYETDKWVSRLMGDRSLGQMPQLYNSKMLGLITKFQLEVRNQLDSQFYDTIQETKVANEHIENELARNAKTAAKVASTFVQLAVVQHLFGAAFESVAGYNPAFDIIEVLMTALGFDDDEDSEDTVGDNLEQALLALAEDLPYASTFLDGGRIPISSALPIAELVKGEDEWGNEKSRWETLGEVAPYYLMPGGYGQLKKTKQGLGMFSDDHPIAGSYTDSGNLRFPVEDTLANRVKAGIFGQYANENARDYFDNERSALKEKQIQEFIDVEMPIKDYWAYREGLNEQETLEDKFDYIAGLDLSVEQKNILINNVVNRKDDVDMENYDDFASYEEFDFYSKNTAKYNFLQEHGVSYEEYMSSDDAKKRYDSDYSWYKNNPEKVTVSKAVTDNVLEYREYTRALNDIKGVDNDGDGRSDTGTRKENVIEWVNNLDIDYGARLILFKSEYNADDTYNYEIIEYLNSRQDISYKDMETILKELGFEVDSNGNITW